MFLQRLSRLLVVCWMESHSVSLAQASESCSRTSQMLNTDSTPALCCSMSRCRSYDDRRARSTLRRWWWEGQHPRVPGPAHLPALGACPPRKQQHRLGLSSLRNPHAGAPDTKPKRWQHWDGSAGWTTGGVESRGACPQGPPPHSLGEVRGLLQTTDSTGLKGRLGFGEAFHRKPSLFGRT